MHQDAESSLGEECGILNFQIWKIQARDVALRYDTVALPDVSLPIYLQYYLLLMKPRPCLLYIVMSCPHQEKLTVFNAPSMKAKMSKWLPNLGERRSWLIAQEHDGKEEHKKGFTILNLNLLHCIDLSCFVALHRWNAAVNPRKAP